MLKKERILYIVCKDLFVKIQVQCLFANCLSQLFRMSKIALHLYWCIFFIPLETPGFEWWIQFFSCRKLPAINILNKTNLKKMSMYIISKFSNKQTWACAELGESWFSGTQNAIKRLLRWSILNLLGRS